MGTGPDGAVPFGPVQKGEMEQALKLDEERLREDLYAAVEAGDSGGCGQYIIMQNAVASADAERLVALARDLGLSIARYELPD